MRNAGECDGKKLNKVIMIVFTLILVAVLAVVIVLAVKKQQGSAEVKAEEIEQPEPDTAVGEKWQEGTISYNGKRYRYNNAINTYLFMGIDHEGPVEAAKDGISGGQSDAMFLLAVDSKAEKISVIAINRNTMTDVEVYDVNGSYIGTMKQQICVQHGYGDGMRTSCTRTVDAVSRLFYNLPINGYLSLNMGGIPILNDAVGGVTVEVLQDLSSMGKYKADLKKGETVTLNGDEAYVYLRSRDTSEFDSATMRLQRQMQYMSAFMIKAKESMGGSVSKVMDVYDSIEKYLVSSIDFAKLAEETMQYGFDSSNMYSIPGETVMGGDYEEYHVDEDALYEMIIDIFYEAVEE